MRHTRYFIFLVAILFVAPQIWVPSRFLSGVDLALTEETRSLPDTRGRAEWKVGYWYWQGWSRDNSEVIDKKPAPVDLLYVHTGGYAAYRFGDGELMSVRMSWPDYLPQASSYVVVFRCEGPTCTRESVVKDLVGSYESLKRKASERGQNIVGLQIDYDCPTKQLTLYAEFLKKLRRTMAAGDFLSITALLDWFRPNTHLSDVIRQVDEFVPQFYDVDHGKARTANGGIAEPIDAVRWAPILNRYGKTYRLGIASFGRLLTISKRGSRSSSRDSDWMAVSGESPLEKLACGRGRFARHGGSSAGETIAYYQGTNTTCPPSRDEKTKLIIPTRQSILSAYKAAKAMGGFCRGVVFFRYPIGNESLILLPSEVSRIISVEKRASPEATTVETRDGLCAAVSCSDLFLRLKDRFPSKDLVFAIRSSGDLEYFVPDRLVQSRMRGPRLIEVKVPAFAGSPAVPVGRAVSREPVDFTVEEKQ